TRHRGWAALPKFWGDMLNGEEPARPRAGNRAGDGPAQPMLQISRSIPRLLGRSWAVLWAALAIAAPVRGQIDIPRFNRDLYELCSYGSRVIGSQGYEQTIAYLRQEIGQLPNVELREQFYPVMVPVTQRADLTLGDGTVEKIYPFWPA